MGLPRSGAKCIVRPGNGAAARAGYNPCVEAHLQSVTDQQRICSACRMWKNRAVVLKSSDRFPATCRLIWALTAAAQFAPAAFLPARAGPACWTQESKSSIFRKPLTRIRPTSYASHSVPRDHDVSSRPAGISPSVSLLTPLFNVGAISLELLACDATPDLTHSRLYVPYFRLGNVKPVRQIFIARPELPRLRTDPRRPARTQT